MGWWQVKLSSGCPLARGLAAPVSPNHLIPWAVEAESARLSARPRRSRASRLPLARPGAPPSAGERPTAPWGSFPLVELCVLIALVIGVAGFVTGGQRGGDHARRGRGPRARSPAWSSRSASTWPATAPTRRCSPRRRAVLTHGRALLRGRPAVGDAGRRRLRVRHRRLSCCASCSSAAPAATGFR